MSVLLPIYSLWPNAASQGRPPDGSGLRRESERSTSTAARRPLVVVVVVVVVRALTSDYLRQASQNLGKYYNST